MAKFDLLYVVFACWGIIFILTVSHLASMVMGYGKTNDKARNKELNKQETKKKKGEADPAVKALIIAITAPLAATIFNIFPPADTTKLKRKLYIVGWSDYFTPVQFMAFRIEMAAIGFVFLYLIYPESKAFGLLLFVVFAIGPNFLLNNSYNNRNEQILIHFPETIRVMSGYLSSGMILTRAVSETAKSASPEWKELLNTFSFKCDTESVGDAIDWIKNEVDILEAREFFAVVKLTVQLGHSVRDGFIEQADLIQELLRNTMQKKIEKRKVLATVIQAPIFLCIIAAFALPVIGTFIDLF